MPILETIGCKCGQCLSNEAFGLLKHHFGYLLDYKKNLKNLEDETTNLGRQLVKINGKVDEANTRGEDILDEVSDWLDNAELKEQELNQFMDNKDIKENMLCFKRLSCPNFMSRYRLSKQANEKIEDVKKLTLEAANYENVSRPKPAPPQLRFRSDSAHFMSFDSREWTFKSIVEALADSDVKIVGVYGPGGVGKTTMVEAVGRQVIEDGLFDEVLIVVASQDATVNKIQGLLSDRLKLKLEAETEVGRADQLWNRLNNGKKNLIILDDIWKQVNLKEIGIPITDENKGCKLVLTSRNRDTWKNIQVHHKDFPIEILSEAEAWDLFEKKVGNSVLGELRFVAEAVCRECRGLPVAINAVGAALKDRELHAWKDALKKLEKSMLNNIEGIDPNLYTSLKLSYDLLQSKDAKSIFLLCCLFPEDADISIDRDLMWHCMARRLLDQKPDTMEEARAAVLTVVGTLKTTCLLLEGFNENYVKMHDVIRDVALSIWKLELGKAVLVKDGVQEWPDKDAREGYSAIVLQNACINELPDEFVCPQLHTLRLHGQFPNKLLKVPDNFFSALENLTVLNLRGICLSSSLAKLVNLRMLSLFWCKVEDASILKDLKKSLEILILRLYLADLSALLLEVGQLTRLRLLNLEYNYGQKAIPRGVISNLTHLEELYIPNIYNPWEGTTVDAERSNASLVELSSLTRLTTLYIHIKNVVTLPKDFRFEKLIRFRISVGREFSSGEGTDVWTRALKLSGITLEDDGFSVLLDRAEAVYLEELQGLKKVIHNRGGVQFLNVKYLAIKNCDDLEYLFSSSCTSGQLQHLQIKDCQMIEKIVGIEGEKDEGELTNKVVNFSQLKYMMLEKLPNLISFYPRMKKIATPEGNSSTHSQPLFNEKVAFPELETLKIGDLPNIKEIWDEQLLTGAEIAAVSCPKLIVMEVYRCAKLVHVVSSTMRSGLQKMKELRVRDCGMMEMIILEKSKEKEPIHDNIIVLHQLRDLSLCNLPNLKSFCGSITTSEGPFAIFNHQVAFPALEELNIEDLPNFTKIWDKQLLPVPENEAASVHMLKVMKVYKCEKLMDVFSFDMLPALQKIRKLSVRDCGMMEVIFSEKAMEKELFLDDIIVFPQLRALSLDNLPNLKSFFNSITTSEAPLAMFNYQVAFPKLRTPFLINCANSREINPSLHMLLRLWNRRLIVRNCDWFKKVFFLNVGGEGQHAGLLTDNKIKVIALDNLPQLTSLWNKISIQEFF